MSDASRQAIIFDWNCTIIDDLDPIVYATNRVLAHFDLPPVSREVYQAKYIVPINNTYVSLGMSEKQVRDHGSALVEIWTKEYVKACADLQLREGAQEALKALRDAGYKMAVLSNYTVEGINKQAKHFSVDGFFDVILANQKLGTAMKHGGKAGYLNSFIQDNGIEKAIIVGDTAEEVEIAHKLGFLGAVITEGAATEEALRAANPDFLIHSLSELPAIAQKVFGAEDMQ